MDMYYNPFETIRESLNLAAYLLITVILHMNKKNLGLMLCLHLGICVPTAAYAFHPDRVGIVERGRPDMTWVEQVGAKTYPAETVFDATDSGLTSDTTQLSTKALQAAIDRCHLAGGGTVVVPSGYYRTGALFLKDNVNLHLSEGVTLIASEDIGEYPEIETRVAGIEMVWPSAVINVLDAENVAITGKGRIDCRGKVFWDKYWAMRKDYEKRQLRWIVDYDCKRVRGLLVSNSRHVTLKDFTLMRTGFWACQVLYSTQCTLDGLKINNNLGGHGPSTDGIDIDSSSRILIENCEIDCNDDNICLKAGRDADGLRVNRPTEYVVVRNCVARKGGGLITCGSETSGSIRYIYGHDLKAEGTSTVLRLKSAMNRGGVVEHIYMSGVKAENVRTVLAVDLNWNPSYSYSQLPPEYEGKEIPAHWKVMLTPVEPKEKGYPRFQDVHLSGVEAEAQTFIMASGWSDEWPIRDFYVSDVNAEVEKAGKIVYAQNFQLENVRLRTKDGSRIEESNNRNLKLDVEYEKEMVQEPVLPMQLSQGAGTLRLGWVCGEESRWLDQCEVKKEGNRYTIKDKAWPEGNIELTICPLSESEGFIIKAIGRRLPSDMQWSWAMGACDDAMPGREGNVILPEACRDNVFCTEGQAFTVYYGKVMHLRITNGVMPAGSELRLSDAHRQESPLVLYRSGKKTDAPVISSLCPWKEGEALYFCLYKPSRKADYAYYMLPDLFEQESKK